MKNKILLQISIFCKNNYKCIIFKKYLLNIFSVFRKPICRIRILQIFLHKNRQFVLREFATQFGTFSHNFFSQEHPRFREFCIQKQAIDIKSFAILQKFFINFFILIIENSCAIIRANYKRNIGIFINLRSIFEKIIFRISDKNIRIHNRGSRSHKGNIASFLDKIRKMMRKFDELTKFFNIKNFSRNILVRKNRSIRIFDATSVFWIFCWQKYNFVIYKRKYRNNSKKNRKNHNKKYFHKLYSKKYFFKNF